MKKNKSTHHLGRKQSDENMGGDEGGGKNADATAGNAVVIHSNRRILNQCPEFKVTLPPTCSLATVPI
jgi:hypothetical protein